MPSLDDFCKRLGIRHPMEQSTCIGYGQRKPTCGCAVAESSRLQAFAILERAKDALDSGNGVRTGTLLDIAGLLLCKRFHQYQAEENVQRWKSILRGYSALRRQATPAIASSSVTPARQVSIPQPTPQPGPMLESCSDEQLMREVRRRLGCVGRVELLHGLVEITIEVSENQGATRNRTSDNTSRNDSSVNDEVARPNSSGTSSTSAGSLNRIYANQPSSNSSAIVDTVGSISQLPTLESTAAVETVGPTSATVASPAISPPRSEPQPRAPSPLRQSHLDCVVCTLSYEEDPDEHWECRQCLNRVHLHCFEAWRASQLPDRVRCIHCRGRVPERTV